MNTKQGYTQKRVNEKSEQIIKLYKEGLTLNAIADKVSSSTITIKKILLKDHDIDLVKEREKKKEESLQKAVELYKQGRSQSFIEKECNLTRKSIRSLIKSLGIVYRDKSDQAHLTHKTEINHKAFDIITEHSAYFIGLLYADGHIVKAKENTIEITLKKDDEKILYKFKEFLQSNRIIKYPKNRDEVKFRFNSHKIFTKLAELGFTSNKSHEAIPPEELKYNRHFWRGVIDGDGGVYDYKTTDAKTNSNSVFLCGTLETVFGFIVFVSKELNIEPKYPSKASDNGLYQVFYYKEAKKVASLLYEDSNIYLDRKYKKYKNLKNN
jgi:hypothetical protein